MLTSQDFPFQLVIHIDENGDPKMTANWRRIYRRDDGSVKDWELLESKTLEEDGGDFPLERWLTEAHILALTTVNKLDVKVTEHEATIAAKNVELTVERAITIAAKAIAAKTVEYLAEQDVEVRSAKEQEVAQLVETLAKKDAELALIKLPEKERQNAERRAQIAKLQAEIDAAEVGKAKS